MSKTEFDLSAMTRIDVANDHTYPRGGQRCDVALATPDRSILAALFGVTWNEWAGDWDGSDWDGSGLSAFEYCRATGNFFYWRPSP